MGPIVSIIICWLGYVDLFGAGARGCCCVLLLAHDVHAVLSWGDGLIFVSAGNLSCLDIPCREEGGVWLSVMCHVASALVLASGVIVELVAATIVVFMQSLCCLCWGVVSCVEASGRDDWIAFGFGLLVDHVCICSGVVGC